MKGKKVLVVDDSSEFSFLLASLFKFHNLEVDAETDPLKALEKLEEKKYDLVVTDFLMNPLDGLELSEKVQSSEKNSAAKVILVSAKKLDADEMNRVHQLNLTYMMKPIMPNNLYRKITELMSEG